MKRNLKSLLCLLIVSLLLVGCAPTSTPETTEPAVPEGPKTLSEMNLDERLAYYADLGTSPDDNYRTWYEIFVYSFCDSNGDGIGDLQGVISKLDYLEELGVTGIWFMPLHPSTSYHKYNVDDYYDIDPDYGTLADFQQLLTECHDRGINVIIDLVVNHSGDKNPWFVEACERLQEGYEPNVEECKYFDYYNFVEAGSQPSDGYRGVPNTGYYYECQFSGDMPDLNWDSELMREDVKNVMQYWLDMGVDGFRVDAAKEFYTGNITKNVEVLNWLQTTATSIKEDAYMVAEVWDGFTEVSRYYESGFTSIFNYPFGNYDGKVMNVVNGQGNPAMVNTWATALEKAYAAYSGNNPDYIDAPFLSNHDVGRIYGFANGDENRIKLAGGMNVLMSGSCFIYYGEEIGMPGSGNDPSKRAPMCWNAERNNGTTDLCPGCSLPDVGYPLGSLVEQQADDGSVYNYYRQAIAIRKALPVLSHGVPTAETALNVGCISAVRKTWDKETCLVLTNINDEAGTVDLSAYADWELVAYLSVSDESVVLNDTTLELPAYGMAILVPSK